MAIHQMAQAARVPLMMYIELHSGMNELASSFGISMGKAHRQTSATSSTLLRLECMRCGLGGCTSSPGFRAAQRRSQALTTASAMSA